MVKKFLLMVAAVLMIFGVSAYAQENVLVCGDLEYTINEDGTATVSKWLKQSGKAIIPETVQGYEIVAIGDQAFGYCFDLEEIILPDGIISIGENALAGDFECISIPASVANIGTNAFGGCVSLERVEVAAENVEYEAIDGVLFSRDDRHLVYYPRCRKNEVYEIPEGTGAIEAYAFANNKIIKEIILPEGVETIGMYAFHYCYALTDITLPEGLKTIEDYVFDDCQSLKKIDLPATLTQLGYAFSDNPMLTTIDVSEQNPVYETVDGLLFSKEERKLIRCPESMEDAAIEIPEGTRSIGRLAFLDCKAIHSIAFPASLNQIEFGAFSECDALQEVILPAGLDNIEASVFSNCDSLKKVTLTENIKSIGANAFYKCPIEELMLPDGLEMIGKSAFCKAEISALTIPGSVTLIGESAFESCANLKTVNIKHGVKDIEAFAFGNCESLTEIMIPASVLNIGEEAFDNSPRVTVYLKEKSTIEQYCIENEVPFAYVQ